MNKATKNDVSELDKLIKQSNSILIIGHINPDLDALSSMAFMYSHLKGFYGKSKVVAAAEKISSSRNYVPGFSDITHGNLDAVIEQAAPDLVIFVDFSQKHMISRENATTVMDYIAKGGIPYVVIDHHPEELMDLEPDLYIKFALTSTCTNLYIAFKQKLGNTITAHEADTLLYGIVADTGMFQFSYGEETQKPLLEIAGELLDIANTDLEQISNAMRRMSISTYQIVAKFLENIRLINPDVAISTLSHDDIAAGDFDGGVISEAATHVANTVISLVENAKIGVLVYPAGSAENTFTVRFRSSDENFPVNLYATDLGGGGHKQSASARVEANSIEEAIDKVREAINH